MLQSRQSSSVIAVAALACLVLLPTPNKPVLRVSPLLAETREDEPLSRDSKPVRVVYPPTNISEQAPPEGDRANKLDKTVVASASEPQSIEEADESSAPPSADAAAQASTDAGSSARDRINLNTASAEDLDQIPGGGRIGRAIVRGRPYDSVDDLLNKRVLRRSTYERIKDEVAAN